MELTEGRVSISDGMINGLCREFSAKTEREKKGHAGVTGTPLADYVGTVVHDHDRIFYSYGTGHQECTQHDIRYLTGSIQNEPEREWNGQMLALFRKMLHYRNGLAPGTQTDPDNVSGFETEYDRILEKAESEYADQPPNDYYKDGYNLFIRLKEYKKMNFCSCMIRGCLPIIPCARDWRGNTRGNRNRQSRCAVMKTCAVFVTG